MLNSKEHLKEKRKYNNLKMNMPINKNKNMIMQN
jgi:hypothetical protein